MSHCEWQVLKLLLQLSLQYQWQVAISAFASFFMQCQDILG